MCTSCLLFDIQKHAEVLDEGERTLNEIAGSLELRIETVLRSPDFRRFLLQGSSEGVVVDLVKDGSPQLLEKMSIGRIVVDSAREILANKLCALLSRTEARDLVDVPGSKRRVTARSRRPISPLKRTEE